MNNEIIMNFSKTSENKKVYESPQILITEIKTEDIMVASGIGTLITSENLLGNGVIEWETLNIEADF
ncbi:MAG: hypothetical protein IKL74_03730 [Clostridia bacterium]|nr:hypothetical protein [Clostridia bacterium]